MKTTKEKIEVMQAYEDGKAIQFQFHGDSENWDDTTWPSWDWPNKDYRIKPEEKKPEYRPYKDTDEMVKDFYKRINSGKASYSMPLIWIRDKDNGDVQLITAFSQKDNCIYSNPRWSDFKEFFDEYEYLDGSPCGKKVE